jgi:hypothetical protein
MPEGGGTKQEVLESFWQRYESCIPEKDLDEVPSGRGVIKWANKVAWCRQDLADLGFVDKSVRNVWRVTPAGREWLARNPDASRLDRDTNGTLGLNFGEPSSGLFPPVPPRRRSRPVSQDVTLEKLERLRQVMTEADFRQDWGKRYDALIATRRDNPVSLISDRQLLEAANREIGRIHDYLAGRRQTPPRIEDIGDWVYLCMTLGLEAEAAALAGIVVEQWTEEQSTADQQFRRASVLTMKLRRRKGNQDYGFAEHQEHSISVAVWSRMRADARWSAEEQAALERVYEHFSAALGEKRGSVLTEIDGDMLLGHIHREVRAIHRFVRGQSKVSPPTPTLCDWEYLCYVLELYAEGATLWQYIRSEDAEATQYERAKKLAAVCRIRVGG